MHEPCDLCNDSGALRDGSPCPRCSLSHWKALEADDVVTRPKRIVWVRSLARDIPRGTAAPLRVNKQ